MFEFALHFDRGTNNWSFLLPETRYLSWHWPW